MATTITRTTVNYWTMTCAQEDNGPRRYEITPGRTGLHVALKIKEEGLERTVVTLETYGEVLKVEHMNKFQAHVNQATAAVRYFQSLIDAHQKVGARN